VTTNRIPRLGCGLEPDFVSLHAQPRIPVSPSGCKAVIPAARLILSKRFRAIGAVLAGDREAYRQIITACEAKVRIVLAAILPVQDMVDDIAKEVFVTAYGKLRDYEPGSDFVAWLKAIARNLALNERRRWFRHARFRDKLHAEVERSVEYRRAKQTELRSSEH
jgi:Sigma-70 region 2